MEQYNVYWKNVYIGRLTVDNTTRQHVSDFISCHQIAHIS